MFTDGLIRTLADFTFNNVSTDEASGSPGAWQGEAGDGSGQSLAIVATGGYGRGCLAPFSDIDLLFLTEEEPSPAILSAVEFMLYFLWDLGLKVGHATRSVSQCIAEAADDTTIRTTLLDARRIVGDEALFSMFQARSIVACMEAGSGGFIADKRHERSLRHHRYGESPFLVEPNIKEGRGGLRDMQTLYWLCRYTLGTHSFNELTRPRGADGTRPALLTEQEAKHANRSWDFSGPFASTCITSPAAPRNGSPSTCSRSSAPAWATRGTDGRSASSASCGTTS